MTMMTCVPVEFLRLYVVLRLAGVHTSVPLRFRTGATHLRF